MQYRNAHEHDHQRKAVEALPRMSKLQLQDKGKVMSNRLSCQMCAKQSAKLTNCWYQYDNGERFIASVCPSCADLHLSLIQKAGA